VLVKQAEGNGRTNRALSCRQRARGVWYARHQALPHHFRLRCLFHRHGRAKRPHNQCSPLGLFPARRTPEHRAGL